MNVWTNISRTAEIVQRRAKARTRQWKHDHYGAMEFIHINKTGGSSIENALRLPFNHYTASERIARLGIEEWNRRYSFTFVRNPWDKLVSQFHFRLDRGALIRAIDFRTWISLTLRDADEQVMMQPSMFVNQLDWISTTEGEILVDDIYRYEALGSEFARLSDRLGVQVELPHSKASTHRHFSEYYDDTTANIVATAFQRDIEFFGYCIDQS